MSPEFTTSGGRSSAPVEVSSRLCGVAVVLAVLASSPAVVAQSESEASADSEEAESASSSEAPTSTSQGAAEDSAPDGDQGSSEQDSAPSGWRASFPAERLPESLAEGDVVVVPTGEPLEPAERAAGALREALRTKGVGTVMDASSLGDVAGFSDQEIVEAASDLPVDRVLIVRVFEGGDAPTGVVAGYVPSGEAVGGFSTPRGTPVSREQVRRSGGGISEKTVEATQSAVEEGGEGDDSRESPEMRLDFSAQKMEVEDAKTGEIHRGVGMYERLERPDLAEAYRKRRRRQSTWGGIGWGSAAVGAAGTAVGLVMLGNAVSRRYDYPECEGHELSSVENNCRRQKRAQNPPTPIVRGRVVTVASSILAVGGTTVGLVSSLRRTHPLDIFELRELVDEQNEPLEASQSDSDDEKGGEADEADESEQARSSRREGVRWRVAATVGSSARPWGVALRIRW